MSQGKLSLRKISNRNYGYTPSGIVTASDEYWVQTSLLLHGDGVNNANNSIFLDSSSNSFSLTPVGAVSQGSFSPFPPAGGVETYSKTLHGGSLYFDGVNSSLQAANSLALDLSAGSWTIEGWCYPTGGSFYRTFIAKRSGGTSDFEVGIDQSTNALYLYSGALLVSSIPVSNGQWTHWAITYDGTTLRMFQNGTSTYSSITANPLTYDAGRLLYVGALASNGQPFTGYLSNLRVLKGTSLYTSSFTPATSPLTNIANTQLLLKGDNAAIFDSTTKNVLRVSGNTKTMVAVNKFGGSSILFDGVGDVLLGQKGALGAADFTIEFWMFVTAYGGTATALYSNRSSSAQSAATHPSLGMLTNGTLDWYGSTSMVTSSVAVAFNTWTHVALCRVGSTLSIYLGGVLRGTGTSSQNYSVEQFTIGGHADFSTECFSGYLDEYRITKGVARYTSSFTPPSSAFLDK